MMLLCYVTNPLTRCHKVHRSNSDLVSRSQKLSVPGPGGSLSHQGSSTSLDDHEDKSGRLSCLFFFIIDSKEAGG